MWFFFLNCNSGSESTPETPVTDVVGGSQLMRSLSEPNGYDTVFTFDSTFLDNPLNADDPPLVILHNTDTQMIR